MAKKHVNEQLKTNFKAHGNRIAGNGMEEDDYGEQSFPDDRPYRRPNKVLWQRPIEIKEYPVKSYQLSKDELEEYLNKFKEG